MSTKQVKFGHSKKFELVYVQSGECYRKIPIILDI